MPVVVTLKSILKPFLKPIFKRFFKKYIETKKKREEKPLSLFFKPF
jgi:hypothetical protein